MLPSRFFLTNGVGRAKEPLASFELALRDAGVATQNIVTVSSIVPPGCKMISREVGIKELKPGEITFCVLARNNTNEFHQLIASSIGVAIPTDKTVHGYLSEVHEKGITDSEAGDYAEDLAASMLASTLGIQFDINAAWNEKEQTFKMSGKIVKTSNITQSAVGEKKVWTTVVAIAVLLP